MSEQEKQEFLKAIENLINTSGVEVTALYFKEDIRSEDFGGAVVDAKYLGTAWIIRSPGINIAAVVERITREGCGSGVRFPPEG